MAEQEKIGERIRLQNAEGGGYVVRILPYYEKSKQWLLGLWLLGLTLCGLYVLFRTFFSADPAEQKLAYVVFLAFFAYFGYMALYAFLWRLYGEEQLWVENGELLYRRKLFGAGKQFRFSTEGLDPELVDHDEQAFKTHFEAAYYVIGKEALQFRVRGSVQRFGEKLTPEEAKRLRKVLRNSFERRAQA